MAHASPAQLNRAALPDEELIASCLLRGQVYVYCWALILNCLRHLIAHVTVRIHVMCVKSGTAGCQ